MKVKQKKSFFTKIFNRSAKTQTLAETQEQTSPLQHGFTSQINQADPAAKAGGLRFGLKRRRGTTSSEESNLAASMRKNKRKKNKKKLILIIGMALIVCIGGFFLYQLFFTGDDQVALTELTTYGSLSNNISGSGTTVPLDSQTVTLASETADIASVNVAEGDTVAIGDLLYQQDDSEIDDLINDYYDEINDLENKLNDYETQLSEAEEGLANLNVTAPFSGTISGLKVAVGDEVSAGSMLATLIDSSTMIITQYVSYAYWGMVTTGMAAYISVADQMLLLTGVVIEVDQTSYVTADGTKCFTVTVSVANPGSLTEETTAACYFEYGGDKIYAVSEAKFTYADSETINAGANGTISSVKVKNYQAVSEGQLLIVIDSDTYQKTIDNLESNIDSCQNQIEAYEKKIKEAEDSRDDYAVKAEIAGTVMEVNIETGPMTVRKYMQASGSAITIYNLDTMTITANIDELDIDYLSEGMDITVSRTSAETMMQYDAKLTYISYAATTSSDSSVATFPCTIEIYSQGALSAGVSVDYAVTVGDTQEGVLAPLAAIQSISEGYCVFIKADKKPDNAIELTGDEDPEIPDGFYAVLVEVGASNSQYIIITSGLDEGTEVFVGYQQQAPENGDTTSDQSGTDETITNQNQMPGNQGEMPSDMSGQFTPPSGMN